MSGAAGEMKNPKKDILSAILISGLLISFFYLMGTIGMLVALPLEDLGLVGGIMDTFTIIFGESGIGSVIVTALGIGVLFTFLANMVSWTMGANRTASEAGNEHELPGIFGKTHPVNKTPVAAYILTGIVSTVVIVLYGFMAGNAEDLFWSLFAFSSIVFLMPYLLLFPAFLKLRLTDTKIERPFKVPGGKPFAWIITIVCELFIAQAILLFVWVPGQPIDWSYALPVIIGVVVTLIIGEILLAVARREKAKLSS